MQTSIRCALLATALACGAAIAASTANAQSSTDTNTGSGEAEPVPMPQLSPSESTTAAAAFMSNQGLDPFPIREPVTGGPIPAPIPINPDLKSATGKLYMQFDGQPHYCTGLFVLEQVIVTAAHCVQENGTESKYDLIKFKREGEDNEYEIEAGCVGVPKEWEHITDQYLRIDYDYAFIKLQRAKPGPLKVQLVNAKAYGKPIAAVGYAASAAPNLIGIWGAADQDPLHPRAMHLSTSSTGFTEGTSGGAWIWDTMGPAAGRPLKVVSINSSYATPLYTGAYVRLYGPNFTVNKRNDDDTVASDLLEEIKDCLGSEER